MGKKNDVFQSWKQKRQVFHPKLGITIFESPDLPTLPTWNLQNSLGLQGDNLVAWFPAELFSRKAFPEKKSMEDGLDLFGWKVNGETKAFLFKEVISESFLN